MFGLGVGVDNQTINFVTDANNVTSGQVTEISALDVSAEFAGFLTGDTVTLENLTTSATTPTETVTLGNGEATVNVSEGGQIVDEVTFLGNFTSTAILLLPIARATTGKLS